MIILKAVKMFQTLLVTHFYRNIHMAAQISRPKAFTLNIFFIELFFQKLLELLIKQKLNIFREYRVEFTSDFRRKITLHRSTFFYQHISNTMLLIS